MRRILVALVLLGAVVIGTQMLGGGSASGSNSTGPESTDPFQSVTVPTGPKLAVSEIEVDAMSAASRAEEQQPTDTSVEEGTLEEAMKRIDPSTNFPNASPGLQRMLGESVYLVSMSGHFTLYDAHVRKGDPPPTGNVLDLVFDAHSGATVGRALPAENAPVGPALATVASAGTVDNGILSGVVLLSGGPKPRQGQPSPAHAIGYRVTVRRREHIVKTATTTARGFRISLPPGHYTVTGTQGACNSAPAVIVRGRTTRATLKCSIR